MRKHLTESSVHSFSHSVLSLAACFVFCLHSFNKYFLSTYYVSYPVLSSGDTEVTKVGQVCPQRTYILGEIDKEQRNTKLLIESRNLKKIK